MNAPRTVSRSSSKRRDLALWRACCLFGFVGLTTLVGCGTESSDQDQEPDVTCTAEAVLARNPATGQCEWTAACGNDWELCATGFECAELPAEACGLDARCHLETTSVCTDCAPLPPGDDGGAMPACGTCYETTVCVPNDVVTGCAQLDEGTCILTDGCVAKYDWLDGQTRPDGGSDEAPDPGADPCPPEICGGAPPPPQPEWGYIGCFDDPTTSRCATIADPGQCDAIDGCHWEPGYDGGGSDLPCYVDPDTGDSDCAAPPPPVPAGYCADGELPQSCWDLYDIGMCQNTPGCEWVETGWDDGTDCACAPDDPSCNCAGLVAPSGYCQPSGPQGCYDIYDPQTCFDYGCEWSDDGGGAPQPDPCLCADEDPNCGCTMPAPPYPGGYCHDPLPPPGCYDYYDPMSCQSDPGCHWVGSEGDRIDPCFGAWVDETGTCRAANDGLAPEYCCGSGEMMCMLDGEPCTSDFECCSALCNAGVCGGGGAVPEPVPAGWCEPLPPPPSCYDHFDATTCQSDPACQWNDGSGSGTDGLIDICYNAYVGADGQCYTEWGDVAPAECCESARPAPPPDECYLAGYGDDGLCYDGFGNVAPDYCCGSSDPIDCTGAWRDQAGLCRGPADEAFPEYCCYDIGRPYCEPRQTQTGCSGLYDEFSCSSAGCVWYPGECDCDPNLDPSCGACAGFCATP